jgi:phospholipid transport system substrate-binding protein
MLNHKRLNVKNMISRRTMLRFVLASAAMPLAGAAKASDHPSVAFMGDVAKELLHAHRQGTVSAFMRVIQRYADIPGIADISLGDYELPTGQTAVYHHGVARFISRYFADQGHSYPVAKYEIGEATVDADKNVYVETKVFMMAGQTYTVTWKLSWIAGTYKVIDAKFLGFSMTNQEKSIFTAYIAKNNGNVKALLVALARQ